MDSSSRHDEVHKWYGRNIVHRGLLLYIDREILDVFAIKWLWREDTAIERRSTRVGWGPPNGINFAPTMLSFADAKLQSRVRDDIKTHIYLLTCLY